MILAKSDTILSQVARNLNDGDPNGPYTSSGLKATISTNQMDDTVIFAIKVSHKDKYEAVKIADAVADVLVEAGPGVIMGTSASIIDNAQVPKSPYSPDYQNNIMIGAAVGLVVALVYVTVMFLKDTRIKDENDLTDMFDLPILGRIPNFDDHVSGARYVDPDIEKGGVEG
jgi:capsular polysaccharide biosynthesis protein